MSLSVIKWVVKRMQTTQRKHLRRWTGVERKSTFKWQHHWSDAEWYQRSKEKDGKRSWGVYTDTAYIHVYTWRLTSFAVIENPQQLMVPLCSGRLVVVKEQGRIRIGGCPLSDLYHHSSCGEGDGRSAMAIDWVFSGSWSSRRFIRKRKQGMGIRGNCFCFWCMIREQ